MATGLAVVDVDPAVEETCLVATTQVLPEMNVVRPLSKTEKENENRQ